MPTRRVTKPNAVSPTMSTAHTSIAGRLSRVARRLARIASAALACRSMISGTATTDITKTMPASTAGPADLSQILPAEAQPLERLPHGHATDVERQVRRFPDADGGGHARLLP